MDMAVRGEGFFQFRKPDGDIVYSRAGNFAKDVDGNIMSQSGYALDPPNTNSSKHNKTDS